MKARRAGHALRVASALVLIGLIAPTAAARNAFSTDVPNGETFDCASCHIDMNLALNLTWFGVDVALTYDDYTDPKVRWEHLVHLDSDEDGQTNGEELGDPCGVWLKGDDPLYEEISNPGDDQSLLADVPAYECDDPSDDDDSAGDDDGPVTSCVYSVGGGVTAGWPVWLLVALLAVRRHDARSGSQS
jgi:hypothetical protein